MSSLLNNRLSPYTPCCKNYCAGCPFTISQSRDSSEHSSFLRPSSSFYSRRSPDSDFAGEFVSKDMYGPVSRSDLYAD